MHASEKKSNALRLVIMAAIAMLLSSLLTTMLYSFFIVDGVDILYFDVNVSDHIGVNLDKDKMHFGAVLPGTKASRYATLAADSRQLIEIAVEGASFVTPSENNFIIGEGEEKKIGFVAYPPPGTPQGMYDGRIIITQKRLLTS